jgi:DNA-directed RNA polymerase specialized sigma subunit
MKKNRHWKETLDHWENIFRKYQHLKTRHTNREICDILGVSESKLYRIKQKYEK